MVQLTEIAAREVTQIIEQQAEVARKRGDEPAKLYLRVGVKGGGCSGFSYSLDLTETMGENDERWTQHGVEIICDPKSQLYLEGTTIDFKDEVMGRGFVFQNPNATSTCGCGSSFAV
ncbi:MAG: iron-sulfur cluster assembly accessory protein [Planctomycetes bacterium]|nr:iron-sulfur cluster assembly accessory protein [Planctomycetota bacterium]